MREKQFSLLDWKVGEVVFVVVVVAGVFLVSLWQYKLGEMRARDVRRKADIDLVGKALRGYFEEHDQFPLSIDGKMVSCGGKGDAPCEWDNGPMQDENGVVFLTKLPIEPMADKGRFYLYWVSENRQKIKVFTHLEGEEGIKNLTETCGKQLQCNWYVEN